VATTPALARVVTRRAASSGGGAAAGAADYTPHHITATAADMVGNGSCGRYWLVPGSMERSAAIAESLTDVSVRESPRGHHAYLGNLEREGGQAPVQVGVVSTGMGCPSVDIILTELIRLGGRRFVRVGSAGGLQPHRGVGVGTVVIATGAMRTRRPVLIDHACCLPCGVAPSLPLPLLSFQPPPRGEEGT
jgi:uridine phosphorylase